MKKRRGAEQIVGLLRQAELHHGDSFPTLEICPCLAPHQQSGHGVERFRDRSQLVHRDRFSKWQLRMPALLTALIQGHSLKRRESRWARATLSNRVQHKTSSKSASRTSRLECHLLLDGAADMVGYAGTFVRVNHLHKRLDDGSRKTSLLGSLPLFAKPRRSVGRRE
jgi:hypothetical protein